jgi:PAS domain S-box-containing protein
MELDARTLTVAVSLIAILQALTVFIYYQMNRGNQGVRWWLWGSTIFSAGFLALLLRDISSLAEISIVMSNALLLLGIIGHYIAITRFLGKREDLRVLLGVFIAALPVLVFFTYASDNISARTAVISASIALISLLIFVRLIRDRPPQIALSSDILAAIYMGQVVFFGARAGYVLLFPIDDIFANNLSQILLFFFMLVASFLYSYGFIIMLNQSLLSEVAQAKDRFELIFNNGPDMAFITRLDDDVVVQGNERFSLLSDGRTGVPMSEIARGLGRKEMIRSKVLEALRREGHAENIEAEFTLRDGSRFVGMMSARRFSVGGVDLVINVLRDITLRKIAEERIQESESKYRLLVEMASEAIIVAQGGLLKLVNPATERLTGRTAEYLVGRSFDVFIHPEDRAMVVENHHRRFRGEPVPDRYPFRVLREDGSIRWAEVGAIIITWEGRPATLNFVTDITERRQAEGAVQEANRKLNLLSSVTRHDINNQLLVLTGRLSLIDAKAEDPALKEGLGKAQAAAERIRGMIQFTKEYESVGVNNPKWHDLRQLVKDEASDVPGHIILVNDVPAGVELYADPLVSKVFHNLISNAVKHGGKLSRIRFHIEPWEGGEAIICEDDGVGIPDEFRDRLFTRGFGKDHGFGLFLSREILNITSISIFEEKGPERGARFVMVPPADGLRRRAD